MMKYLITIILSLILSNQVYARCSSSGIWTYPSDGEISQNSIFIIEGFSRSQGIIDSLNIRYPMYLQADGHTVRLEVVQTHKGMFLLTQAILKPKSKLLPGKTYILKIRNYPTWEGQSIKQWNSENGRNEAVTWKVSEILDVDSPEWIMKPKLVDKKTALYGCGPEAYSVFDLKIKDNSRSLIKTELYNIETNQSTTYYLTLEENGKLNVGHGMCSGAFRFNKENNYKIRFSLIDLSGNSDNKWTDWLAIENP